MQPHPMTSVMQFGVTVAALIVAASVAYYTVTAARIERNAALVSIGIAVLRADPSKESQVSAAREWALNLIDANAGGVKFSGEARDELLKNSLHSVGLSIYDMGYDMGSVDTYGKNLGYVDTYGPGPTPPPKGLGPAK